jgi:hypothetical protein
MKGVLLYVVHPGDANLLHDDFRLIKKLSYSKTNKIKTIDNGNSLNHNRLQSPMSQKTADIYRRNIRSNQNQSPKRILYIRGNETGINRELTPPSGLPMLPQLSYTPINDGYHSKRDESAHRRHRSPKKSKKENSSSKLNSDDSIQNQRHFRSQSPDPLQSSVTPISPPSPTVNNEFDEQDDQSLNMQQLPSQHTVMWPAIPIIPMGIYNR